MLVLLGRGVVLTPNAGGYAIGKSFHQTSGASMRRIVDLLDMSKTETVLPTGQSGLQKSPHYKDQAFLFHSGKYKKFFSMNLKLEITHK